MLSEEGPLRPPLPPCGRTLWAGCAGKQQQVATLPGAEGGGCGSLTRGSLCPRSPRGHGAPRAAVTWPAGVTAGRLPQPALHTVPWAGATPAGRPPRLAYWDTAGSQGLRGSTFLGAHGRSS